MVVVLALLYVEKEQFGHPPAAGCKNEDCRVIANTKAIFAVEQCRLDANVKAVFLV